MKILLKARTGLGNIMEIGVSRGMVTMKRAKDAKGKAVNDNICSGNHLNFCEGRFIVREGKTITGETFGKAEITDVLIS